MLDLESVRASYGRGDVLRGVSMQVAAGKICALIGPNGAGKSTLMRTVIGARPASGGNIFYQGRDITGERPEKNLALGLALVPEGRKVFASMSVAENLEMGAFRFLMRRNRAAFQDRLDFVLTMFPKLKERYAQLAGTLSGGEQQMLAIGRALMSDPKTLLLDEPSMGLAPLIVRQIFETLVRLRDEGLTIFVCEQNTEITLRHADMGYVLEEGQIVLSGAGRDLLADERVKEAYLGL